MIEKTVQSTHWGQDGRTEVVFDDDSTLWGEAVEIVAKLRPGQKVELVPVEPYGTNVKMMTMRIGRVYNGDAGQELVPIGDEVLQGEVVEDPAADFDWAQWTGDDGFSYYKLRVGESWFQRVEQYDVKSLQALLIGISELARKTGRGPRVPR